MKIGEAARLIGSTPHMLRKWEASGGLLPARKTRDGTRYYSVADLLGLTKEEAPTSADQRRRAGVKCRPEGGPRAPAGGAGSVLRREGLAARGDICDRGSGLNDRKKGLRRLVLLHNDGLLKFGAELVFVLCEEQGIEIVIVNRG